MIDLPFKCNAKYPIYPYIHRSMGVMSDDEFRAKCKNVTVFYVFDRYSRDIPYVMKMVNVVKAKHPYLKKKDMSLRYIERGQSDVVANHFAVVISIPVEKFLRLRRDGKIKDL